MVIWKVIALVCSLQTYQCHDPLAKKDVPLNVRYSLNSTFATSQAERYLANSPDKKPIPGYETVTYKVEPITDAALEQQLKQAMIMDSGDMSRRSDEN